MERPIYIAGEKVSLWIFQKEDVAVAYSGINNLSIQKLLHSPTPYMYENEEKWYQSLHETGQKQLIIVLNDTKEVIGSVGFNKWEEANRNGEIGITLYKEAYLWKGYGTEAMRLFLQLAFRYFWAHRVELWVFAQNTRAIASYKKAGFRQCGILKEAKWVCGEYIDQVVMEMLDREYDALYPKSKEKS